MSEWTHSQPAAPAGSRPRGRFMSYITGTVVILLVAGIAFQVYRAEPGMAQSREGQAGSARVATGPAADEILARVNNQPITYEQVAKECFDRHGSEALDNVINRMMIVQECQRAGVQVTEGEIQQEVLAIAKKFNIDVGNWYALLKNERGIDQIQYHRDVIYPMLALKKLAGQNIQVTNDDMQRAFVRDYGPRVEARMILLEGNARQAQELWQSIKNDPENFHRYAQEHSADPNTRALGGVVPPIRRYADPAAKNVEETAFGLQIGEISPLVEVGGGRHVILKCEGHTKPVVTDIREVWDELKNQVTEEKTQEQVAKVFSDIRTRARVINHLTGQSTGSSATAPGSIQQTSAAQPAAASQRVQNAGYTAPPPRQSPITP
jgi:foldase protein PrsA